MLITIQLIVAMDFHNRKNKILWKSMATVNCLVTNSLKYHSLCLNNLSKTNTSLSVAHACCSNSLVNMKPTHKPFYQYNVQKKKTKNVIYIFSRETSNLV